MTEYLVEADWYVEADTPEQAREIAKDIIAEQPWDVLLRVTDQADPNDKGSY